SLLLHVTSFVSHSPPVRDSCAAFGIAPKTPKSRFADGPNQPDPVPAASPAGNRQGHLAGPQRDPDLHDHGPRAGYPGEPVLSSGRPGHFLAGRADAFDPLSGFRTQ